MILHETRILNWWLECLLDEDMLWVGVSLKSPEGLVGIMQSPDSAWQPRGMDED